MYIAKHTIVFRKIEHKTQLVYVLHSVNFNVIVIKKLSFCANVVVYTLVGLKVMTLIGGRQWTINMPYKWINTKLLMCTCNKKNFRSVVWSIRNAFGFRSNYMYVITIYATCSCAFTSNNTQYTRQCSIDRGTKFSRIYTSILILLMFYFLFYFIFLFFSNQDATECSHCEPNFLLKYIVEFKCTRSSRYYNLLLKS